MDQKPLVDTKVQDGLKLATRLVDNDCDVTAAFWILPSEEGDWTLYLASKFFDDRGAAAAYRKVADVLQSMGDPWVSMSEFKVVSANSQIAKDVLDIRKRYPNPAGTRSGRSRIGEIEIEAAYVYPPIPSRKERPEGAPLKLKAPVAQVDRPEDFLLTQEEQTAIAQLMQQGVSVQQAEEWVRKRREKRHPRPPIPAGTVVRAWPAAFWGDTPENDPNPLLMVEGPDGARGLTFKEDTEPVE